MGRPRQIHRCILPEHPLGIRCGATRPRPARSLGEAIMKWVTANVRRSTVSPVLADRPLHRQGTGIPVRAVAPGVRVAKRTGAIPYDIPGAELSHVGELCSFDASWRATSCKNPRCTRWRRSSARGHFAARTHAAIRRPVRDFARPVVQLCRRPRDAAVWADPV